MALCLSILRGSVFSLLLAAACWGQAGFSVSSGSAAPSGAVDLNLSFAGNGSQAASLQWKLAFPTSVAGVNITPTSLLTGAGKNVTCVAGTGAYTCIASGNFSMIPDGVIASAQFTLSSGASNSTVTVSNAIAASTSGSAVTVSASGGSITVTAPAGTATPALSSLSCAATSLAANSSNTCRAALSGAAPSGGVSVLLSDDNSWVSVPGYVTVPAGATSATFTASAGSIPSGSSGIVTITATLAGISRTASLACGSSRSSSTIRVNAGGGAYTTPDGVVWSADTNFANGSTWSTTATVSGTTAPALYQTQRWGQFTYQFAVPSGTYTVNLKFAEAYMSGAGQRVFDVAINGSQVLSNFDIFAQAGGAMKALDKSFPVTVTNGQINITFNAGTANWPMVNGIEIVSSSGAAADFNQDGVGDVIWQDPVSGWAQVWYLGGAQGVTTTGAANLTAHNTWRIVGAADFDRDGHPDVVWQDPASGTAQVWFLGAPGGNVITNAATISAGNSWRIMSIADFNGDGIPDCILQDQASGWAQIWFMGGAQGTTITGAVNLTTQNTWRIAGTGDFNGDGVPDVVWQDPVSGAPQIWYLGGAQGNVVQDSVNLFGSNPWKLAAIADFNGDGHPDVVWQDPVTGASQVWFLGGAQGITVTGSAAMGNSSTWRIMGPH
jgi:hypothetical protein